MATVYEDLGAPVFYSNGDPGASGAVGFADKSARVVRYKFTTPSTGASKLAFMKHRLSEQGGNPIAENECLRFFVSADPDSHIAADETYEYHGEMNITTDGGWLVAQGSVDGLYLLPNKEYYFFVFPGFATIGDSKYGLFYWSFASSYISLTLEGTVGLMHIETDSGTLTVVPYIDDGTSWGQFIGRIEDGTAWHVGT